MGAASVDLSRLSAQCEHAAAQAAFWQSMAEQLRRDQRNLRLVPAAGVVLAAFAYLVFGHVPVALGVVATAIATWLMGLYFVAVRAQEYTLKQQDAQNALRAIKAELAAASADAPQP